MRSMVRTTRREFVKAAAASCIALAAIDANGLDSGAAAGLPNPVFAYEFGDIPPKQPLRASMDLREPSSIMRGKSPNGCGPWTRRISSYSFFG
jgi:hypothetical protein